MRGYISCVFPFEKGVIINILECEEFWSLYILKEIMIHLLIFEEL